MVFAEDAELLQERGYAFDFISDRQLQGTGTVSRKIRTGCVGYRTIVVPAARSVPLETLRKLLGLAENGATVIFHRQMPEDVPGLADVAARQTELRRIVERLSFSDVSGAGAYVADVGEGRLLLGDDLETLLELADVRRERLVEDGLQFVRRRRGDGADYFIANWSEEPVDDWVPLAAEAPAAVLFDPMTGKTGLAGLRPGEDGESEVYLQLDPGESIIVRTHETVVQGLSFRYYEPTGAPAGSDRYMAN